MERRPQTQTMSDAASPAVIKQPQRTTTEQGRNRASSLREEAQEPQAEKAQLALASRTEPLGHCRPGFQQDCVMALGFRLRRAMLEQPAHITTAETPQPQLAPAPPAASQHLPNTQQPRIPLLTNRSISASAHTSTAPPVWMHRAETNKRRSHLGF